VNPGDSASLAEGILRLLADMALREQLAAHAVIRVSQYDNRVVCNHLFDLYEQTVPMAMIRNGRCDAGMASQRDTR
jgi:hypothetical protein